MENAADALKMAFGVLVFIVALTVLFFQLSQIKQTADTVLLYSDKTNYYEWETGSLEKRKSSWRRNSYISIT